MLSFLFKRMEKIGIIGGTFNPIHIAHLAIAEQFYDQIGLDKCYFVPTFQSPFKIEELAETELNARHRLNMVKLALGSNPHFQIDDFEIENKGISYSYLTIGHFKNKYSNSELYFLIGQDQANHFHKWKKWQEICKNSQLTIAKRIDENSFPTKEREQITDKLTVGDKSPMWIDNTNMEISSSDIRERFKQKKSTNYLLPDKVYDYIKLYNLYI